MNSSNICEGRSIYLPRTPEENERLGPNIQTLTTPELCFEPYLLGTAPSAWSWEERSDQAPAPMHSEACSSGSATCCG